MLRGELLPTQGNRTKATSKSEPSVYPAHTDQCSRNVPTSWQRFRTGRCIRDPNARRPISGQHGSSVARHRKVPLHTAPPVAMPHPQAAFDELFEAKTRPGQKMAATSASRLRKLNSSTVHTHLSTQGTHHINFPLGDGCWHRELGLVSTRGRDEGKANTRVSAGAFGDGITCSGTQPDPHVCSSDDWCIGRLGTRQTRQRAPGFKRPFSSASRMSHSAARSLIDPPGFINSALPSIRQPVAFDNVCSSITARKENTAAARTSAKTLTDCSRTVRQTHA